MKWEKTGHYICSNYLSNTVMKIPYYLVLILLLFVSNKSLAQYTDTVVQYFDMHWKKVNPKKQNHEKNIRGF